MRIVVGITGGFCSGKSMVCDYFESHGYKRFRMNVILEDKLKDQGKEVNRKNMRELGQKLRSENGEGYLGRVALQYIRKEDHANIVIDALHNPDEIMVFKENPSFILVAVSAPVKLRYKRFTQKYHDKEVSLEDFVSEDDYYMFGDGKGGPNIMRCMDMSNVHIVNDGDVSKISDYFASNPITEEILRPSWDKYFMQLAWITSQRCNCLRHKIGAVIVRDKRVISAGYNGTPTGMLGCAEGGCKRCNDTSIPSGEKLDECICIHAEESAILESGHVNCKGTTLYTTHLPCISCAKKIIHAQMAKAYYVVDYSQGDKTRELFKSVNFELVHLPEKSMIVVKQMDNMLNYN